MERINEKRKEELRRRRREAYQLQKKMRKAKRAEEKKLACEEKKMAQTLKDELLWKSLKKATELTSNDDDAGDGSL